MFPGINLLKTTSHNLKKSLGKVPKIEVDFRSPRNTGYVSTSVLQSREYLSEYYSSSVIHEKPAYLVSFKSEGLILTSLWFLAHWLKRKFQMRSTFINVTCAELVINTIPTMLVDRCAFQWVSSCEHLHLCRHSTLLLDTRILGSIAAPGFSLFTVFPFSYVHHLWRAF